MKMNGSQLLIECLIEQGVNTVFGYPGGAALNIYDALYKNSDRIKHILTSHEQNAAHAADGYARSTGKVGVCIATSGPGATNLITGIATAYMDSSPVIAITCNVVKPLLGKDTFQEIDIFNVTMPITKHNYMVKDINDLASIIRDAFRIAQSGRPGPVVIDIPKDLTAAMIDFEPIKIEPITVSTKIKGDINECIDLINKSEKPFIYAGGGIIASNASEELFKFANLIDCPVATSFMGLGCFPEDNKLATGMIGMHGSVVSNRSVLNCDLLLAIGTRFSDRVLSNVKRFAPHAKIVHIDIDPSEHGKNIKPFLSLIGDAKVILNKLLSNLKELKHPAWITQVEEWKKEFVNFSSNESLNPRFMMEEIKKATKDNAIITTEVGQHQMWAGQFYKYNNPRTFISSGGLGTMGFGTGAAMGCQVGNPDKIVVNIAGDGSFRMNLTELSTIEYYNLPIIIVLMNNKVLGMVRQWQTDFYGHRYSQTTLDRGPDFNKLCDAYGIKNYKVTTKQDFTKALEEAIKSHKPALLNCIIDEDDKVLPMVPGGAGIDEFILK